MTSIPIRTLMGSVIGIAVNQGASLPEVLDEIEATIALLRRPGAERLVSATLDDLNTVAKAAAQRLTEAPVLRVVPPPREDE